MQVIILRVSNFKENQHEKQAEQGLGVSIGCLDHRLIPFTLFPHYRACSQAEFLCMFSNLKLSYFPVIKESLLLYQMGNLEECKKLGEDVCAQADKFNSPNYNAITGKAMSVISGAYKQEGNFAKAEQILESSTEVNEPS